MDVLKAIRKRRSIRRYKEKPVAKKKLRKVLEAARWAPSSGNNQPWEFIVIRDQEVRDKIAEEATYGDFISDAPVSVAFITDPEESHLHKVDGALATQNFQLAAWALGLGTCWIGTMNREKVKSLLEIPKRKHLLTVLPLGYPAGKGKSKRKKLDEITYAGKYGEK